MEIERRFTMSVVEPVTSETQDSPRTLRGLAAPYYDGTPATEYRLWDGCVERYTPGCFRQALGGDVFVLFNHDPSQVLGRTSAGTASLMETDRGLAYSVDLAETQLARDVLVHVQRGDITGSSAGWVVTDESWTKEGTTSVRNINVATLYDVSPVTFPAYAGTEVQARSISELRSRVESDAPEESGEEQEDQNEPIVDWLAIAMMEEELKLLQA